MLQDQNQVGDDDLQRSSAITGGGRKRASTVRKSVLYLHGADDLDKDGAALVRKYNVVLLAIERAEALKAQFGDGTFRANRLTDVEMRQSLAILHPSAGGAQEDMATNVANGDVRQAQFHLTFGTTKTNKAKIV